MKQIIFLALTFFFVTASAQDTKPFTPEGDATYYDFWEGTWYAIKEDNSIDSTVCFIVKRGPHRASFTEEWRFGNGMKSIALRAWDKTNNKWGFVWVSDNALYQVWDTKKVDGHWYIYRRFTVENDNYLSRQGFIPQPDGTVLRISEKTYDEKSWELRFRQRLRKMK